MDHQCMLRQALPWEVPWCKRSPDCPLWANWRSTVNKDFLGMGITWMGITWEEAEMAAQNKSEWRRSVTQFIHLDVG